MKTKRKWTKKKCFQIAKKYKTRVDWIRNDKNSYMAAHKYGWLKHCCKHMLSTDEVRAKSQRTWTKEKCLKEAKKYKNKTDWYTKSNQSYEAARRHGWIEDCSKHMMSSFETMSKAMLKWTPEKCLKEARKHKTRWDWRKADFGSVRAAKKYGIFEECVKHMKKTKSAKTHDRLRKEGFKVKERDKGKISFEECISIAKRYDRKIDWQKEDPSSYARAKWKGWYDKCVEHMISSSESKSRANQKWTLEMCVKEAKKYKTRSEWQDNSLGGYPAAGKKGWLDTCCEHMPTRSECLSASLKKTLKEKRKGYKQECLKDAKKYKTRTEWALYSTSKYSSARKYGWIEECCKHMPKGVLDLKEVKVYGKYKKLFEQLGIKFDFMKRLSSRSIIEFVVYTSLGKFGVEVKHDEKRWAMAMVKRQLNKYRRDGTLKQNGLKGIILSSPKGRYGHSLKELKTALEKGTLLDIVSKKS